jgi:hypothetical protein
MAAAWRRRGRKRPDPDPLANYERCPVSGKIRYPSERVARRALPALQQHRAEAIIIGGLDLKVEKSVYRCWTHCGGWHTSSLGKDPTMANDAQPQSGEDDARQTGEELEAVSQAAPKGLQQNERGEDHERGRPAREAERAA